MGHFYSINPGHFYLVKRTPACTISPAYARLIRSTKESAWKRRGSGGNKIGNIHLKWAFSEAAVLFLRNNPRTQNFLSKLTRKHGKSKALAILAHSWDGPSTT